MINSGNSDKQVGLYSGGLIFRGGAYIWTEVSVSSCGGLIQYTGELIYSEVYGIQNHITNCRRLYYTLCNDGVFLSNYFMQTSKHSSIPWLVS